MKKLRRLLNGDQPHNEEEKYFFITLIIISFLTISAGIFLTIYFCIIAYNATHYLLFMYLLIFNAVFSIVSLILNIRAVVYSESCKKHGRQPFDDGKSLNIYFGIQFALFFLNFWSNVVFFFKDVYIDSSIWWSVLVPIFIIIFVGSVRFFYQMKFGIGNRDNVLYSDFWRPIRIVGICSSLLLCAIVGPSVVWIKVYMILQIISFALFDIMH
jgi:hypothetical protein